MIVAAPLAIAARSGAHVVGAVGLAGALRVRRIAAAAAQSQPPHGFYRSGQEKKPPSPISSIAQANSKTLTTAPNFHPKNIPKKRKESEKISSNYLPNQCRDPDGRLPLRCSVRAAPSRESRAAVRAGFLEGSRRFWKPPIEQDWPNGERLEGSIPLVFDRVRRFSPSYLFFPPFLLFLFYFLFFFF